MEPLEIGSRLRKLRREKHMSLTVLANKSGVSTGLISQIERDLVAPSVVSLYHIAQALDTDISYFFSSSAPPYTIQRRGTHHTLITNNGLNRHQLLSTERADRALDLVHLTLKGGEVYDRECIAHEGEECCYVLSGTLTFLIDDEELTLEAGDSICFSSTHPHLHLNTHEEDCVYIWAIAPNFF